MGKKGIERRVYTKEFKAEAAALAEKREKPVSRMIFYGKDALRFAKA